MRGFDPLTNRITRTITVKHGENPYGAVQVRDTFSKTREYVADSFQGNGSAVTAGLSVDETTRTVNYALTGLTAGGETVITYQTRFANSAFLNANGVPKAGGSIKCETYRRDLHAGRSGHPAGRGAADAGHRPVQRGSAAHRSADRQQA